MSFPPVCRLALLALVAVGTGGGCATAENTLVELEMWIDDDGAGTIRVSDELAWWRNTISADAYYGWATQYDEAGWHEGDATTDLVIRQEGDYQQVTLNLDRRRVIEMTWLQLGWGWNGFHRSPVANPLPVDLISLGLAPDSDEADFSDCMLSEARTLVALSDYPYDPDVLMDAAAASAREAGVSEPMTWHDVVQDPSMYRLLFEEHLTRDMASATFAYVSLQLDPLCGRTRTALRSEEQLAGFIRRVPVPR